MSNAEKGTAIPNRVITIYATQGDQMQEFTTNAQTLSEFKNLLDQNGVSHRNLKLIDEFEREYNSDNARLPEKDFVMFMMPEKTKSGSGDSLEGLDFWGLRDVIKDAMEEDGEEAEQFFRDREWHREGKVKLIQMINDYRAKNEVNVNADICYDDNVIEELVDELVCFEDSFREVLSSEALTALNNLLSYITKGEITLVDPEEQAKIEKRNKLRDLAYSIRQNIK